MLIKIKAVRTSGCLRRQEMARGSIRYPQPVERADVTEFCDFETQAGLGPGRPAIQCLQVTRSFHVCDVTTSLKRAADRRSLRVSVSPPGKYAALLHTKIP